MMSKEYILSNLIIKWNGTKITGYEKDEFYIPHDSIDEYYVMYQEDILAKFWICNNYPSAVHFLVPLDVYIVRHILYLITTREYSKEGLTNGKKGV